jgi:hypothetical protein
MSDFTTPVQFESNAQATVQKLNSFINQAVLDKSFVSGKDTLDNADLDILNDLVLIYDASAGNLKNATSSDIVDACLTNKFRGKIYAPSTSVMAGININSDEVTGDIVTEPGDLIISNDNLLFVASDNKLLPILDTGENYFKNPVVIKNPTPSSLTAVNSTGGNYIAFGVNNQGEDKSNSFIILWSGNAGIGITPSTSARLSIGDGIKFSDGTIQTVSGNNGTGLPNNLIEDSSTVNQNTYYNWTDPNSESQTTQTFRIKLDWGNGDFIPYENATVTYPLGNDVNILDAFPPFTNAGNKTWKIKPETVNLIQSTQTEHDYWQGYPGCENDGPGACETNPITYYKGYELYEFSAYQSTVSTLVKGDVHGATNTYSIPEKSWVFRDNSTGFIQQWILLGSGSVIDPPQNIGTPESPIYNKIYRYKLPTAFPNACFGVTVVPERNNVSTSGQFSTPDASYYQIIEIPQYYLGLPAQSIFIMIYVKVPEVIKPALYGQWNADIDIDNDGDLNTVILSNSQLDFRSNAPHGYFRGGVLIHAYGY